jgi:hypothetical protein
MSFFGGGENIAYLDVSEASPQFSVLSLSRPEASPQFSVLSLSRPSKIVHSAPLSQENT